MRLRLLGMSMLLVLMASFPAPAQVSTEATIRGHVRDEQKAVLPGVLVTATSPDAPGARTATTDGEGLYRLLDLAPGVYTVTAELEGFTTVVREGVVVRAGLNLGLDLTMSVGSISETVTVKADTPLLESRTAIQAVNIAGEFQRSVPVSVRRNWSDFLFLTPGVVQSEFLSQDYYFYVHGADQRSHVIQLDGADIGAAAQGSTLYLNMGADVLADVQVKTGGADASAPLGQGAVINIASQSGTNSLRGTSAFSFQHRNWSANNNPSGTISSLGLVQVDASLGGPVARDKWWYFGTVRYAESETGISRSPAQLAALAAIAPGFVPFDRRAHSNVYFAKATGQPHPNHQVTGFYQYDSTPLDSASPIAAAPFFTLTNGGTAVSARLNSVWGSSVTTRIGASWNNKAFPQRLRRTDRPGRVVHQATFLSGGRRIGSGALAALDNHTAGVADQPFRKTTLWADLTYYRKGWMGSHEVQTGVWLQPQIDVELTLRYANNGFYLQEEVLRDPANPRGGSVPFHRIVLDSDRVTTTSSHGRDYALYVQDAWGPTPRVTVTGGVRFDFIRRVDRLVDVVLQDSTEIGPRAGVNVLLTADGRNSLRANWGIIHDNPTVTGIVTAGSNRVQTTDLYDLDLNGTFETTFITPGATTVSSDRVIDLEHWNQPFVREYIVGYRRQFPGQVLFDVGVIRREFRERMAGVEINRIYENNLFRGYRDETLNDVVRVTSSQWNWPIYHALEMQVTKQGPRVQLLGGYTRQWQRLGGTWTPSDVASIIQPTAFANDRGIGFARGAVDVPNSLSGTDAAGLASSQWRPHVLRLSGTWAAPWGLRFATTFTYQSGSYSGPVVTRIAAPDPQYGPPTVRLSNGRVVSNPLATVIRFAFPTRGEGQLQLPSQEWWNLRLGRDFRLGRVTVHGAIDVLNLLNDDADQEFASGANQQYNPNYGVGALRMIPRAVQVSARVQF